MNNQEVNEFMHRYLDDDLSGDEAALLEEHLRHFPASSAMFERLKQLNSDLEQLPKVTPPISIVDAILPRLEREGLWNEESVPSTEQNGLQSDLPASVIVPRVGKSRRFGTAYRWLGGVVAAGIALTVFITTLGPGTTTNDSANENFSSEAAKQSSRAMDNSVQSDALTASESIEGTDGITSQNNDMKSFTIAGSEEPDSGALADKDMKADDQNGINKDVAKGLAARSGDVGDRGKPMYSLGFVDPEPIVSPDEMTVATITTQPEGGQQIVITDHNGNLVFQTAIYEDTLLNLHWSTDSKQVEFDVASESSTQHMTIDLVEKVVKKAK